MTARPSTPTYLLVDGENLDGVLGSSILDRKPAPEERPRWDRLRDHVESSAGGEVKSLFFINASAQVPLPFVQALISLGFRPILLKGAAGVKVVDIAIIRMLKAIAERGGNVALASHDGDFVGEVKHLIDVGASVSLLGFREFFNADYRSLVESGAVQLVDLEDDVKAFNVRLPRTRVIDIDEFDPMAYL